MDVNKRNEERKKERKKEQKQEKRENVKKHTKTITFHNKNNVKKIQKEYIK